MKNTYSLGFFSSVVGKCFFKFILKHEVVCGQLFQIKHLTVQHYVSESYFLHFINGEMWHHQQTQRICVAWIMHLQLCLLGYNYCLLACWSVCYMFLRVKEITKVCAIQLRFGGEHMFSTWPFNSLCLLFSVKLQVKGWMFSHACHYCCSELWGFNWCG